MLINSTDVCDLVSGWYFFFGGGEGGSADPSFCFVLTRFPFKRCETLLFACGRIQFFCEPVWCRALILAIFILCQGYESIGNLKFTLAFENVIWTKNKLQGDIRCLMLLSRKFNFLALPTTKKKKSIRQPHPSMQMWGFRIRRLLFRRRTLILRKRVNYTCMTSTNLSWRLE